MPKIKSSVKDIRKNKAQREINRQKRSALKTTIRKAKEATAENQTAALNKAYHVIDKSVKTGLIKKNNAARKKSRLTRIITKKAA